MQGVVSGAPVAMCHRVLYKSIWHRVPRNAYFDEVRHEDLLPPSVVGVLAKVAS